MSKKLIASLVAAVLAAGFAYWFVHKFPELLVVAFFISCILAAALPVANNWDDFAAWCKRTFTKKPSA